MLGLYKKKATLGSVQGHSFHNANGKNSRIDYY